jgi:hypothetical protein
MKVTIDISDEKFANVSTTAKTQFANALKDFGSDVLDEASRLESTHRSTSLNPEVTATDINDAVFFVKRHGGRRISMRLIIHKSIAFLSTLATGGIFNVEKFKDSTYVFWFLVLMGVALVSQVLLFVNNRSND